MYPVSERVNGQARGWQWRRGGACRGGLRHMREVVAGAGAHEGHVGWRQHIERGLGMSEGWGVFRGMGHILGSHGVTHRMLSSVGRFAWMQGWTRVVKKTCGWGPDPCA